MSGVSRIFSLRYGTVAARVSGGEATESQLSVLRYVLSSLMHA
jgi:hypothetical protein